MRRLTLALLACAVLPVLGCGVRINWNMNMPTRIGSGVSISEERPTGEFDQIELRGAMNIEAKVGQAPKLTLEADDNLLEIITTHVEGKKLIISTRENYRSKLDVKIMISTPTLSTVELNGSGKIVATDLAGAKFEGTIRGSGDISATGTVDVMSLTIAGSGDLDLGEVKAKSVSVTIAGSGHATVHATETLNATIAGSGDIVYLGDPQVHRTVHGSGSVRRAK